MTEDDTFLRLKRMSARELFDALAERRKIKSPNFGTVEERDAWFKEHGRTYDEWLDSLYAKVIYPVYKGQESLYNYNC